ncbi:nitroreductase [Streptomyces sp. TS71-3]|uniref:nitroreductase n=1 Tax=Streptomyces sp. TS71-3 TaxID=2733862 RepID=UPI001B0D07C9|nr:nitroreductase [Streptomyces sp. TS71-3]GHJ39277.1 hypothetical protein Sm713_48860 [Streptomyces sp. TS71-3]
MSSPRLDEPAVVSLVGDAVTAPSPHHVEPWRFRHVRGGDTVELRMDVPDAERAGPREERARREPRLECGAALFNLRVSAAHGGWRTRTELMPDPDDPELLAVAALEPAGDTQDDLAALYPALGRHGGGQPFGGHQIPAALLDELRAAAVAEGARLVFPDARQAQALLDLDEDAETLGMSAADAGRVAPRWSAARRAEASAAALPSAVPAAGPPGGGTVQVDVTEPVPPPGCGTAAFDEAPAFAVLGTREDGPRDWLLAGQALERVLLRATLDDLALSLDAGAVERRELRWALHGPLAATGYAQMLLRLGQGAQPPTTPRRPVADVLSVV